MEEVVREELGAALIHEMGRWQRWGRIPVRDEGFRCSRVDQRCHRGCAGDVGAPRWEKSCGDEGFGKGGEMIRRLSR
jgi:hypothetical protein